jgi:predicted RecB family endonuclease
VKLPVCTRHNLKSVTMLWIARLVGTSKIAATLCLGLIALLGDYIVVRSTLSEDVRAIVDNIIHGAIGLLSWHIVTTHLGDISLSMRVCQVVFCGFIASAVDLDHFAAARSLRIQVLQPYMLLLHTGVLAHIGYKCFYPEG